MDLVCQLRGLGDCDLEATDEVGAKKCRAAHSQPGAFRRGR
jgi:hypothetical protein